MEIKLPNFTEKIENGTYAKFIDEFKTLISNSYRKNLYMVEITSPDDNEKKNIIPTDGMKTISLLCDNIGNLDADMSDLKAKYYGREHITAGYFKFKQTVDMTFYDVSLSKDNFMVSDLFFEWMNKFNHKGKYYTRREYIDDVCNNITLKVYNNFITEKGSAAINLEPIKASFDYEHGGAYKVGVDSIKEPKILNYLRQSIFTLDPTRKALSASTTMHGVVNALLFAIVNGAKIFDITMEWAKDGGRNDAYDKIKAMINTAQGKKNSWSSKDAFESDSLRSKSENIKTGGGVSGNDIIWDEVTNISNTPEKDFELSQGSLPENIEKLESLKSDEELSPSSSMISTTGADISNLKSNSATNISSDNKLLNLKENINDTVDGGELKIKSPEETVIDDYKNFINDLGGNNMDELFSTETISVNLKEKLKQISKNDSFSSYVDILKSSIGEIVSEDEEKVNVFKFENENDRQQTKNRLTKILNTLLGNKPINVEEINEDLLAVNQYVDSDINLISKLNKKMLDIANTALVSGGLVNEDEKAEIVDLLSEYTPMVDSTSIKKHFKTFVDEVMEEIVSDNTEAVKILTSLQNFGSKINDPFSQEPSLINSILDKIKEKIESMGDNFKVNELSKWLNTDNKLSSNSSFVKRFSELGEAIKKSIGENDSAQEVIKILNDAKLKQIDVNDGTFFRNNIYFVKQKIRKTHIDAYRFYKSMNTDKQVKEAYGQTLDYAKLSEEKINRRDVDDDLTPEEQEIKNVYDINEKNTQRVISDDEKKSYINGNLKETYKKEVGTSSECYRLDAEHWWQLSRKVIDALMLAAEQTAAISLGLPHIYNSLIQKKWNDLFINYGFSDFINPDEKESDIPGKKIASSLGKVNEAINSVKNEKIYVNMHEKLYNKIINIRTKNIENSKKFYYDYNYKDKFENDEIFSSQLFGNDKPIRTIKLTYCFPKQVVIMDQLSNEATGANTIPKVKVTFNVFDIIKHEETRKK